jgi:hypothetical protein
MGYRRSQQRVEKMKKSKYNSNIKYDSEKDRYKVHYDFNYWSLKYGRKFFRKKIRQSDTPLNHGSYRKIKNYIRVG